MATTYKQAYNDTLIAGSNTLYTVPAGTSAQVRAFTAHNPTMTPITLVVSANGKDFAEQVVASKARMSVAEVFNQQINAGQSIVATGAGMNLWVSVAEVVG